MPLAALPHSKRTVDRTRMLHLPRRCASLLSGRLKCDLNSVCELSAAQIDCGVAACSALPLLWSSAVPLAGTAAAGRAFSSRCSNLIATSAWGALRSVSATGGCRQLAPLLLLSAAGRLAGILEGSRLISEHGGFGALAAARLLHSVVNPPGTPTPELPPAASAAPPPDDQYDEADHAELAQQLEDQHGPAEPHSRGGDAAGGLSAEGPHSAGNIVEAAAILRVRPSPPLPEPVPASVDTSCRRACLTRRASQAFT